MKNLFLALTILGFVLPNIFVVLESVETGNILLYAHPLATVEGMFANRISTIFMIDLLLVVVVFFVWSYVEGKKLQIPQSQVFGIWGLSMLLGLGGGLPLFLYVSEKKREKKSAHGSKST